jgi:hypothetical protein
MMDGVNSTITSCKNFCKCHNVPQYNNNKNKFLKIFKRNTPFNKGGGKNLAMSTKNENMHLVWSKNTTSRLWLQKCSHKLGTGVSHL